MNDLLVLAVKAVNGGLFVVAFALIGEMANPKRFAGMFSAAPSIALANLLVVAVADGSATGVQNCWGMIVGAVAFAVACAVGTPAVARLGALRGSVVICGAWLALAGMGYVGFLR